MPEPTTPVTGPRTVDMSNAPGADLDWDSLFGTDPESAPAQPAAPATPEPQPQPAEPVTEGFFLKTPTGTVYKTQDEAIRGFTHKDEVIESLRRKFIETTGNDPITGKPVATQPQQPQPPAPADYFAKPETLWDNLEAAVKAGDKTAYARTLQEFVGATLAPYAEPLNKVIRESSVDEVNTGIQGFKEWRYSPQFTEFLGKVPLLKNAIETTERNPQMAAQLPELYQYAYWISQGQRTPEINAAVTTAQQPQQTAVPVQTRPTTTPSTQPPIQQPAVPNLRTTEGRKAIIQAAEARGVADVAWDSVFRRV